LKQLTAIFVVDGGRHVLVFVFYNRLAYTVQVGGFILKQFNSIQFNSIAVSSLLMEGDTRYIFVGESKTTTTTTTREGFRLVRLWFLVPSKGSDPSNQSVKKRFSSFSFKKRLVSCVFSSLLYFEILTKPSLGESRFE
jgi:hypothetical protein